MPRPMPMPMSMPMPMPRCRSEIFKWPLIIDLSANIILDYAQPSNTTNIEGVVL